MVFFEWIDSAFYFFYPNTSSKNEALIALVLKIKMYRTSYSEINHVSESSQQFFKFPFETKAEKLIQTCAATSMKASSARSSGRDFLAVSLQCMWGIHIAERCHSAASCTCLEFLCYNCSGETILFTCFGNPKRRKQESPARTPVLSAPKGAALHTPPDFSMEESQTLMKNKSFFPPALQPTLRFRLLAWSEICWPYDWGCGGWLQVVLRRSGREVSTCYSQGFSARAWGCSAAQFIPIILRGLQGCTLKCSGDYVVLNIKPRCTAGT